MDLEDYDESYGLGHGFHVVDQFHIDLPEEIDPTAGFDPNGYHVYLLWENRYDKAPVYVGSSGRVIGRLGDHVGSRRNKSPVFNSTVPIAWITLRSCESRAEMLAVEEQLIQAYRPKFNSQGLGRQVTKSQ